MVIYIWFPSFFNFAGITLFPFIFINKKYKNWSDKEAIDRLINHESIHIQQQKELLVIPFYILYLLNWFINIFIYKLFFAKMYRNIVFEVEAYKEQDNTEYLKTRKWYNWIKYFKFLE